MTLWSLEVVGVWPVVPKQWLVSPPGELGRGAGFGDDWGGRVVYEAIVYRCRSWTPGNLYSQESVFEDFALTSIRHYNRCSPNLERSC